MRSPIEEGRRWLEQAEDDLKKARYNLEGGYCDLVCFLCQQVAEKALKAYFYDKGMEAAWTHSVERLLREAEKQDSTFSGLIAAGTSQLDGYYVPTRYPNALPGSIPALVYGRGTAEKAIELAEQAVQFVKRKMGQD